MRLIHRSVIFLALLLALFVLAACGGATPQSRENQAIETLRATLPASTREAQGLPFGGWSARMTTDVMTVTLPLNMDSDTERGLRAARAALVKGAAQLFRDDAALQHLTIVGTLPNGPNQADVPALVGDIDRADVVSWDGAEQLGLWKMTVPAP